MVCNILYRTNKHGAPVQYELIKLAYEMLTSTVHHYQVTSTVHHYHVTSTLYHYQVTSALYHYHVTSTVYHYRMTLPFTVVM